MTTDLAVYTETINEAWNSHDMERVLRFYSPDCTAADIGQASVLHGHEDLRRMLERFWQAFPDLRFDVMDSVVQGSRLAIIWVAEGTHQGKIMNIPPTGHRVQVRGMSVIDVENGLIVRGQSIWDQAAMLRHLGLLPELQ